MLHVKNTVDALRPGAQEDAITTLFRVSAAPPQLHAPLMRMKQTIQYRCIQCDSTILALIQNPDIRPAAHGPCLVHLPQEPEEQSASELGRQANDGRIASELNLQ